jgi:hypothetical protein
MILGALAIYLVYIKIINQNTATASIATAITETDGTGTTSGTPTTNVPSATSNSTAQTVQQVASLESSNGAGIVLQPSAGSPLNFSEWVNPYAIPTINSQAY